MRAQNVYAHADDLVFLKQVMADGQLRVDVMSPDGRPLIFCRNVEIAKCAAEQYGMVPVMVH